MHFWYQFNIEKYYLLFEVIDTKLIVIISIIYTFWGLVLLVNVHTLFPASRWLKGPKGVLILQVFGSSYKIFARILQLCQNVLLIIVIYEYHPDYFHNFLS